MLCFRHLSSSSSFFFVLALAAVAGVTSGHEHENQHSHLCEGAGFNLFCAEGKNLKILKAWYGRIAHDTTSCIDNTANNNNSSSNSSSGAHPPHPHPDLPEDCGSSVLASKDSWCKTSDKGGCTITVKDLAPKVEEKKCPDSVTKYLYLEYECVTSSAAAGRGGMSGHTAVLLGLMMMMMMLSSSFV